MTVQQWLGRGYWLDKETKKLQDEWQKARDAVYKVTAQTDGERVQTSGGNTYERNLVKYLEYDRRLNARIDELYAAKKEIEQAIENVTNAKYRVLLICRYVKYMCWKDIAEEMNYSERQLQRIHKRALKEISI